VRSGSVDWGDMDHDGDIDLLLTGESNVGPVSKVYRNDTRMFKGQREDLFTDINAEVIGLYMSDGHWVIMIMMVIWTLLFQACRIILNLFREYTEMIQFILIRLD